MYLGIDLGTSGVKAVLVDDEQKTLAEGDASLRLFHEKPLWSEQDPEEWWIAASQAIAAIRALAPKELAAVRAIGLSGQMHGATLLDAADRPLRRAILWNDGRSHDECAILEQRAPASRSITGNLAMPGFTAPKLIWVQRHEPDVFAKVRTVLLPKDYLRLRMTGERASDMSDSAGTLWMDVAGRKWSSEMLAATGLGQEAMPRLYEGTEATGTVLGAVAKEWGIGEGVIVAAGAGDNAAGAVGVGVVAPSRAFLSLGTSGVYFVSSARYQPYPQRAVHTFCHCLPGTWHQMSVILSAASCLAWLAKLFGVSEASLIREADQLGQREDEVIFLPYLSGERTPHNDPRATGVFVGMTHDTTRGELCRAVLEGVAFAFADGQDVLREAGTEIGEVSVIGGGARSALWGRILASVLDRPLVYRAGGAKGPAYGAARLGRLARTGEDPATLCTAPPVDAVVEPDPALRERYRERLALYRTLYQQLVPVFHHA